MPDTHTEIQDAPQTLAERPSLESLVSDLIQQVRTHYPDRLALGPAALKKRIVRLLDARLLPHRRPSGRPRLQSEHPIVG
jgi:hypothetical protein